MMNKQQILRKIGDIIQELNEQHQYLKNTDDISLLELELFTANADFLIDHIEILKKLSASPVAKAKEIEIKTQEAIAPAKEIDKPIAKEADKEPIEISDQQSEEIEEQEEEIEGPMFDFSFEDEPTEMIFDFEKKIKVEEVFDRELSEEEKEFLKSKEQKLEEKEDLKEEVEAEDPGDEEMEEEDIEEEGPEPFLVAKEEEVEQAPPVMEEKQEANTPVKDVSIEVPPVQDVPPIEVKEKRLTLNEMLSAKLGNKPSGAGGSKGVADLKVSISLNDKMIFIKELFNGYNLAYSEAIEIINRFESLEAADNFLQKNYAAKNDWENKQRTVGRLYEYLNKRFVS